jgi:hypothetical protein
MSAISQGRFATPAAMAGGSDLLGRVLRPCYPSSVTPASESRNWEAQKMYDIDDYEFDHFNMSASPLGGGACDIFHAIVEFVFY